MAADYVAAWKAFKTSEQFQKWTDTTTLGRIGREQREYLENRILAAFEHGWNMHLAASAQETRAEAKGCTTELSTVPNMDHQR